MTHYTEEETLAKVGGMPSKKASPSSTGYRPLNSRKDSELTTITEGFNSIHGLRHRPPPVRISRLGPEQVRIEQANSRAKAITRQLVTQTLLVD